MFTYISLSFFKLIFFVSYCYDYMSKHEYKNKEKILVHSENDITLL